MKHDEFFRRRPVFTGEEFAAHLAAHGEPGKRGLEALLAYHRKAGRLVMVRRGLYAVIPPGYPAETYPVDPFLVASKLAKDAVISHHTALEFHGRAYSVQERFTYTATRPPRPLKFRNHVFQGAVVPKALRQAGEEMFGVSFAERAGMELRVTSLERTLVDVLDRPDLSGTWEEIWRSLESVEFFDLDKVLEYVLLHKNATCAAKVGFYLDQHRKALMVEDRHLKALRDLRPRQPHYLERAKRESGRFVPAWNLVAPREVVEQAWGDVL
jgi:predicted transcriptional regulator of viral defense system